MSHLIDFNDHMLRIYIFCCCHQIHIVMASVPVCVCDCVWVKCGGWNVIFCVEFSLFFSSWHRIGNFHWIPFGSVCRAHAVFIHIHIHSLLWENDWWSTILFISDRKNMGHNSNETKKKRKKNVRRLFGHSKCQKSNGGVRKDVRRIHKSIKSYVNHFTLRWPPTSV